MPASRAVLTDILEHGLDPKKAHSTVGASGRLRPVVLVNEEPVEELKVSSPKQEEVDNAASESQIESAEQQEAPSEKLEETVTTSAAPEKVDDSDKEEEKKSPKASKKKKATAKADK